MKYASRLRNVKAGKRRSTHCDLCSCRRVQQLALTKQILSQLQRHECNKFFVCALRVPNESKSQLFHKYSSEEFAKKDAVGEAKDGRVTYACSNPASTCSFSKKYRAEIIIQNENENTKSTQAYIASKISYRDERRKHFCKGSKEH